MKLLCCLSIIVTLIIILFILFRLRTIKQDKQHKKDIAIALLVRNPVDFPLWLKHHRNMGISKFFIRLEDSSGFEDYLKTQSDIEYEIGYSSKENNYKTLQDRQLTFVNKCLKKCLNTNIKWIFHIDSDELLDGSLDFLNTLGPEYKTIKIQNAEAMYNENEESCFSSKHFLMCSKGASCRSYVNGKSAGRTESGVYLAGPHDFYFNNGNNNNYDVPFDKLHVLHFDSCSFGAWVEKFKHLSNVDNSKNPTPFKYYNNSISVSKDAFELYREATKIKDTNKDLIYKLV